MAKPSIGLPSVQINFKTSAGSAITRSSRGKVALILNDDNYTDEDGVTFFSISEASDIPSSGISAKNADLIKKTLAGSPAEIFAFLIPPKTYQAEREVTTEETVATTTQVDSQVTVETTTSVMSDVEVESEVTVTDPDTGETSTQMSTVTVQSEVTVPTTTTVTSSVTVETTTVVTGTTVSNVTVTATVTAVDAFKEIANTKVNYIAYPGGDPDGQQSLASFASGQRKNRRKTVKAVVANYPADSYSVINFTTGQIKVDNPDYVEALEAADGDATLVSEDIPRYRTYTAAEYTGRIAGILAGLSLDRSATYYTLPEIISCKTYDDADEAVNRGELILIDEHDGMGVKIGRGVNSLVNFSNEQGEDFRYIKIIEAIDLIQDDITVNFRENYVGKVVNNFENRMLFVSMINNYLKRLVGPILDNSSSAVNRVDIDTEAVREWAAQHGKNVAGLSGAQLENISCGTHIFLKGNITPVNAMEDLKINFVL